MRIKSAMWDIIPKSGPAGQSVPAQVHQTAEGVFKAEFVPRSVGEHRVNVTVNGLPTAGSPYAAKVSSKQYFILYCSGDEFISLGL